MNIKEIYFKGIYHILIKHAGAPYNPQIFPKGEGELEIACTNEISFLHAHIEADCWEYRFQGKLGFGGKYYRDDNRVSFYSEDETPEKILIKETTNIHLRDFQKKFVDMCKVQGISTKGIETDLPF